MTSLRLENVAFAYTDRAPLFVHATCHLTSSWTGLVGANGAGKSTLLDLFALKLCPNDGQLIYEPKHPRIALCSQSVETLTPELETFAATTTPLARRLVGQLQLEATMLRRWSSLSPGERKRWQMGAALAAEPDVLLLDEPSNHADSSAKTWLFEVLQRFTGLGVLVSHDRQLLTCLTRATLRLHAGELRLWPGPYPAAKLLWEQTLDQAQQARTVARQRQQRGRQQLANARREQQAVVASQSARKRMKSKHDHDARSLGAKTLASWADARIGQQVRTLRQREKRLAAAIPGMEADKTLGRSVFVNYQRAPNPFLLSLEQQTLSPGGQPLLGPLTVAVKRGSRIWLCGPNGAGKTTLIEALLDHAHIPKTRLLYLPQELSDAERRQTLDDVRALPAEVRGQVLACVAALGVDPGQLLASAQPSPGEARKLRLALGLGQLAWALVLDEPTNHLDLPSIERLEVALAAYPGALLIATHDNAFAQSCTNERWLIHGHEVRRT